MPPGKVRVRHSEQKAAGGRSKFPVLLDRARTASWPDWQSLSTDTPQSVRIPERGMMSGRNLL